MYKNCILAILAMLIAGCTSVPEGQFLLDHAPVVAKMERQGKNNVLVAKYASINSDTLAFPLSALVEDIRVVKLDPSDQAIVGRASAWIAVSENYIISHEYPVASKLFDKDGRYIGNIGAIGRGPGEYFAIYDEHIDEVNGKIYLMPFMATKILVYDLQGKALDPIPLYTEAPKAIFRVHPNNTVTIAKLPFQGDSRNVVWTQDFSGKILSFKSIDFLSLRADFSNEVISTKIKNGDNLDFCISTFWGQKDTVYHYNTKNNTLKPQFTMDFGASVPIHSYFELPHYYLTTAASPVATPRGHTAGNRQYIMIDKVSYKGAFCNLQNDFLGNIPVFPSSEATHAFKDGYYVQTIDPILLQEYLEAALRAQKDLPPEVAERVQQLMHSISEDDNNYVIYGKLKQ